MGPPMIAIRKARDSDAPVLCRAEAETARTPGFLVSRPGELVVRDFRRKIAALSRAGRYVAAVDRGAVVGHAFLEPMGLRAVAHVFRLTVVVHPGHRGKGIGTALMRDLLTWAMSQRRVGKIELLVRSTNGVAINLYRRFGFVEEGRFRRRIRLPNGRFLDDISMAWFPPRRRSRRGH